VHNLIVVVIDNVTVARFAHYIELFIMDAFVDMFITLCIVINTIFMAMDHHGMDDTMTSLLKNGNYVSSRCHGNVTTSLTKPTFFSLRIKTNVQSFNDNPSKTLHD